MARCQFLLFFLVLSYAPFSLALPILRRQDSITALSASTIDALTPFTHFASAAYCPANETAVWQCGANCQAPTNSDFVPTGSGGDGASVQFWYVGFSPSLKSVIVAHQGTDPGKIQAIATDLTAIPQSPDPGLFPGIPSDVKIHSGFLSEHAKTANDVLTAVKTTMAKNNVQKVTAAGHSLGAALSAIEGAFLLLNLPGVNINVIGYGMPRVGNQAFADFMNAKIPVTRVNNQKDPVPTVPGAFLGYTHANGEAHITESGIFQSCPGSENQSPLCTDGDVTNIFEGKVADHTGPYNGISMGC
ncbi:alpha/beta-hydrolase [Amanita rubescens]|jgi:hypothetical protein|nr:alpha/beta-hydrolase [Amanita rubescens]